MRKTAPAFGFGRHPPKSKVKDRDLDVPDIHTFRFRRETDSLLRETSAMLVLNQLRALLAFPREYTGPIDAMMDITEGSLALVERGD